MNKKLICKNTMDKYGLWKHVSLHLQFVKGDAIVSDFHLDIRVEIEPVTMLNLYNVKAENELE